LLLLQITTEHSQPHVTPWAVFYVFAHSFNFSSLPGSLYRIPTPDARPRSQFSHQRQSL